MHIFIDRDISEIARSKWEGLERGKGGNRINILEILKYDIKITISEQILSLNILSQE